jgi:hyperosmotically inducible periplasmic protein
MHTRQTKQWSRRAALPLGALLAVSVFAMPAMAGDLDDQAVQARIQQRLLNKDLDGVTVEVENGVATLFGSVETLRQRDVAANIARDVEGVTSVQNDARVMWGGRTTDEIASDVERALYDPNFNTVFDWVQADVAGRTVVLTGWVTMPWKIETAAARMSRIPGVEEVQAKIEVLPVSIFDDEIRVQSAQRLYRSLAFSDRAGHINPPVHIVVRHGEVILMGEVRNKAEMMLARSLVSSAAVPFRIANNLRYRGDGRS